MSSPDPALATAESIGRLIAGQAVWDGRECNWIGANIDPEEDQTVEPAAVFRALDETLYDGTAGVGLFLAELHAATGDGDARRAALGALRQALSVAQAGQPTRALYAGVLGIALAAARAGRVLDVDELTGEARALATSVAAAEQDGECDLMAGAAGAAVAMLALSDLLDDPSLLASAEAYGDELIDRAEESSDGWSWASPGNPTSRNLTGFSHGVAGIAVALLELHRATGARRFADAAARGLDYERATFSPDVGNWPDFREHAGGSRQRSFAAFWCHGAPGIGLSRLRAAELGLGNGNGAGDETRAALATTRAFVDRDLAHGRANLSLCHGLCGNAEILAEAGDQGPANAVARHGRHAYEPDGSWPCGMPTGQTPSLMVGLAGIGHFYLRRSDPRVPSVLLIRREQWAAATA